jgi:cytochrome c553
MKLFKAILAVLALATSSAFPLQGYAQSVESVNCAAVGPFEESAATGEKLANRNCTWCHAAAVPGFAVAPRLAGQHVEYIKIQLDRLNHQTRDNPFALKYMSHAAAQVGPEAGCQLAAYFAALPPIAVGDGDEKLIGQGREIFLAGIPSQNVPACAFCHGPEAQGVGIFPRLGGQSYHYIKRRLEQWGEGYSKVASHMPGIAKRLEPGQVEALASYLSFQK